MTQTKQKKQQQKNDSSVSFTMYEYQNINYYFEQGFLYTRRNLPQPGHQDLTYVKLNNF